MDIRVSLSVKDKHVLDDVIQIEDHKLEELTEDEMESVVEIMIRSWLDRTLRIEWEAMNGDGGSSE